MNYKKILIGTEARDKVIKGANFLADAVRSTLGPYGLNALIEKGNKITNDGVTISGEFASGIKDELERRGAIILHEAATKTNSIAGDGTTTAIILAQEILKETLKFLGNVRTIAGKKPVIDIIKTIEKEKDEIIKKLGEMAKPIETEQDLVNSAIVSVEDKDLGEIIGKAKWKLGRDGVLLSEETAERTSSVEFVNGIRIDNGFGTSYVINNQEKQSLEIKNVAVIMTNFTFIEHSVNSKGESQGGILPLKPILDQLLKVGKKDVVIIGRGFSSDAILDCQENFKNGFRLYPINAPYIDQNEVMKDMVAILGGNYANVENCVLESMQLSDVGYAEKVVAKRWNAIFTGHKDEEAKRRITKRVEELKEQLSGSLSDFEKKNLKVRIAQLTSGFGIVKVGSVSDTDRKYKADKAEDAVNAVRAAYQEGVVSGAGLAFNEIAETLPDSYILKQPIKAIYNQIKFTAPEDFIIEDWVKDPLIVLKTALEQACYVAGILASANCVIASYNPQERIILNQEENAS